MSLENAVLSLFFSYSHKDELLRDELEIHLAMLKRQGVISAWHDRGITAGSDFGSAISAELEAADIALLLISPYFLASEYCYEKEMQRAMERHRSGSLRVIPVILHPCEWEVAEFKGLQAVPKDGIAISMYPNQHEAFLQVTKSIRKVADEINAERSGGVLSKTKETVRENSNKPMAPDPTDAIARSSNLRIKKTFTDRDIDSFYEESFEYLSKFFEKTLHELQSRNEEIECAFRRIDANHFTAIVYRQGKLISECKIWLGGRSSILSGICYSGNISSDDNSMNDSMSVVTDGHTLYLNPMGFSHIMTRGQKVENLSQQGASEYYWAMLMRPLQ